LQIAPMGATSLRGDFSGESEPRDLANVAVVGSTPITRSELATVSGMIDRPCQLENVKARTILKTLLEIVKRVW
jgi:hypothetical protein